MPSITVVCNNKSLATSKNLAKSYMFRFDIIYRAVIYALFTFLTLINVSFFFIQNLFKDILSFLLFSASNKINVLVIYFDFRLVFVGGCNYVNFNCRFLILRTL